jgi:hypothetical protein
MRLRWEPAVAPFKLLCCRICALEYGRDRHQTVEISAGSVKAGTACNVSTRGERSSDRSRAAERQRARRRRGRPRPIRRYAPRQQACRAARPPPAECVSTRETHAVVRQWAKRQAAMAAERHGLACDANAALWKVTRATANVLKALQSCYTMSQRNPTERAAVLGDRAKRNSHNVDAPEQGGNVHASKLRKNMYGGYDCRRVCHAQRPYQTLPTISMVRAAPARQHRRCKAPDRQSRPASHAMPISEGAAQLPPWSVHPQCTRLCGANQRRDIGCR